MLTIQEKEKKGKGQNMKNIFQFSILAVIVAFIALQMTGVYADKAFVGKTGQTAISEPGDDGDWQAGASRSIQERSTI